MNRCGNNQFQTPLQDVNKDMFYFSSDHRRNSREMGGVETRYGQTVLLHSAAN